jgi:hypothetical protein
MANKRHQLTQEDLQLAIASVANKTNFRAKQKGLGCMASGHEILGIIEDEVQEYRDEVHAKADAERKIEELKDIAVGAIWGIASIQSGGVDW